MVEGVQDLLAEGAGPPEPESLDPFEVGEAAGRGLGQAVDEPLGEHHGNVEDQRRRARAAADRFTVPQKVRIVADVCRGLDFAHKQGVVHRDVKPANVRVGRDGEVKILDFGIARLADSELTQAGTVLGTPSYISPEILRGGPVDHRADMWATGVILYEIVSGRRPFEAATITGLVYKIVHEPPPPLDHRALGLPEALVAAATRALHKDPSARFPDMAEMGRALLLAIGDAPAEPSLDPVARRRAYELNHEEARRRREANDLSGALEAARRAQSLEPGQIEIVALVAAIEGQLREAETVKRPPRTALAADEPTRVAALGTLTDLRTRGASAFRELATFGEPPAIQRVALSPVKDAVAAAGTDGAIRVWNLHTRAKELTLRTDLHRRTGHDALALSLAFSPDGALLASGHVDGNAHLWDLAKGEEVPVRLPTRAWWARSASPRMARPWPRAPRTRTCGSGTWARPSPANHAACSIDSRPASPPSPTRAVATGSSPGTRTASCACWTRAREGSSPPCGDRRGR